MSLVCDKGSNFLTQRTDGFFPVKNCMWQGRNAYKSLCGLINCAALWNIFFLSLEQKNKHRLNCQEHSKRKQNPPKQTKIKSNKVILRKNLEKLLDPKEIFLKMLPTI